MTGDGVLEVDKKFEQPFSFINRAKMIMTYNKVPYLSETTTGIRRRLMIIPFDLNLEAEKDKKIHNIQDKLAAELPGILNRVLVALDRVIEKGEFTEVSETQEKVHEMMADSDPIYEMWTDHLEITGYSTDLIYMSDLWDYFDRVVDPGNIDKRMSQRNFYKRLRYMSTKNSKTSIVLKRKGNEVGKAITGIVFKEQINAEY